MITHGEKCRKCNGNMTAPKPITDGPRKGQTRIICVKCGYIDYRQPQGAPVQAQPLGR